MTADEIAKRPTPLTDAMREHLSHDRVHMTQQRDAAEDLCEQMEQDRAALMEALEELLAWTGHSDAKPKPYAYNRAAETLAAVEERSQGAVSTRSG